MTDQMREEAFFYVCCELFYISLHGCHPQGNGVKENGPLHHS